MQIKMSESLTTRKNNFDIIRFIAALMVVWFHSYPLTLGIAGGADSFARWTGGQATSGGVAVSIFFIISGFLITMSYDRSNDFWKFTKARVLRIFPGIIFVVLLSIFILGPVISTLSYKEYFTNYQTYKYLAAISLYKMQYILPGVFESNIYPGAVNGSLWTLWYEFLYYIVVGLLGVSKLLNKQTATVLFLYSFLCSFFNITDNNYVYLFMYFSAGMVFYFYRESIQLSHKYAAVAAVAFFIFMKLGLFNEGLSIFGAYLIFYLALGPVIKFTNFSKYGDLSYGIYIFSFPIQQCVTLYFQNQLSPLKNFLVSLPFILFFSFISWHVVESKFMLLKDKKLKDLIPFRKQA
ncbi:Acyltransferase family protein [Carnobacterium maltaromaticum]|uniref:acyltransferase family protein n=1 Tax=Carnobacterium maltaromaticum TaxID=2751 RepID=UPI00191B92F9|nr:acyltransferase [Carnobacterium maltaromaticum]CAD5900260.1 Acyltransferase family protein [Carnobacterium maltaromaticum]CAD5900887.1 Acyltransferase family protein [Carnobacterium maltaromaticum]